MGELRQLEPTDLARYIDAHKASVIVDQGSRHCYETCKELRRLGWRYKEKFGRCSVATYEDCLEKDGYVLHAISAYFYGTFCDYSLQRPD